MSDYCAFIKAGEDWLMGRILHYSKVTDYTKYTSTLRDAWRLSINMLSQTLCEAITSRPDIPELGPDEDYSNDPIASFGILEAQRHRERGVTLEMFLGLMKYYRQSYLDYYRESSLADEEKEYLSRYTDRFYDRVELGFIGKWTGISKEDHLKDLEATNRRMTNEKNKYLTIFESQHDPALLLNKESDIENINFAAARLFEEKPVPGAAYYRQLPVKEKFPWLFEDVEKLLATDSDEVEVEREIVTFREDKKIFKVKLKRMLDISNKFSGVLVIMNDITETKKYQQAIEAAVITAERASKAKSDFLAHMSHELRTPLNGILGYAQILRKDLSLTGNQRAGVEIIEKSGNHLLGLINDILDLSKIEANKIELTKASFKLSDLLKNVIEMIRIKAWQKKLGFRYLRESDLPEYVVGDEKRIGQILINLLGNAIKFTDEGSVSLTASYDRNRVTFVIKDTGIGIDREKLEQIFTPFKQLTQREGTGLGLSISKKLIELMNGSLDVESSVGQGSEFTVSFELDESLDYKQAPRLSKGTISGYQGPRKKIVIVDDKEINRLVLLDFLEPLGFTIIQAVDGIEGYQTARKEKPDLVITDLVMPGMDGFELARKIKSDSDLKGVKIFAVSASTFEAERNKSYINGADEFIPKPINFDVLIEKMAFHLALSWVCSVEPAFRKHERISQLKNEFAPILPPEEVVRKLYEYALEGDLDSLKAELEQVEAEYPEAKSFFSKLSEFAWDYKIGEICDYLAAIIES